MLINQTEKSTGLNYLNYPKFLLNIQMILKNTIQQKTKNVNCI